MSSKPKYYKTAADGFRTKLVDKNTNKQAEHNFTN